MPAVKSEAELYLEMADVPMATNVLVWWAEHEEQFPTLSVMARQYLGVPQPRQPLPSAFSALPGASMMTCAKP